MTDSPSMEKGRRAFVLRCIEKGGPNKNGPNLNGLFGRKTGQAPGYKYTQANKERGITWTKETLDIYLQDPKRFIPGTKMMFSGLRKPQERADLIAYLEKTTTDLEPSEDSPES